MASIRIRGRRAVAVVAAAGLGVVAALPVQAAFRATGDVSGLMCAADGADCAAVRFDEVKISGRFTPEVGAVFDAVTVRDPGTGLCRVDLGDTKLADASPNMRNLLRAKFIVNSHDGATEVAVNTLEFACVEE